VEQKVIVIVGPTCSGKTNLSINLAAKLSSEIISADSRQMYKYLTIGTAKPTKAELEKIPHHFVDLFNPYDDYNASKFEKEALAKINELHKKNIITIVVGGSGLYIRALVDGIFDEVDQDEKLRNDLLDKKKKYGNEFLYNLLLEVDPKTASNLLPQNWKRIMRALEVYHLTGKPIWKFHQTQKRDLNIEFHQFGLNWKREILYKNIEARVDDMINLGLVEEVKSILNMGFDKNLNSLNTVGYKEIIQHFEGEISLERSIELIKRNTRRYAKRQLTWFRKDKRINWFDISSIQDLNEISEQIINATV